MIRTEDALKTCQDVQHIIDITSQHLDRLRWGGIGGASVMYSLKTWWGGVG